MTPKTSRESSREDGNCDDDFEQPPDILKRAKKATKKGVRFLVTPQEIVELITLADEALKGDSNDAEHDALYEIRAALSGIHCGPFRIFKKTRKA